MNVYRCGAVQSFGLRACGKERIVSGLSEPIKFWLVRQEDLTVVDGVVNERNCA